MKKQTWIALLALAALLTACSDDDAKKTTDMTVTTDKAVTTDVSPDTATGDQATGDQAIGDQATGDQTAADQATGDQSAADLATADQTLDLHPGKDAGLSDAKAADASPAACGGVTYEGCCNGSIVWYCDSGKLKSINCSSSPKCGWDSSYKVYDCGTSGGSDPSGKHTKACKTVPDFGVVDASPTPDKGPTKTCGSVSYEGCCDGTTLKYCSSGTLTTIKCATNPKCGWDSSYKLYDCGTSGGSDPSGKYPKACKSSTDAGVADAATADAATTDAATADAATADAATADAATADAATADAATADAATTTVGVVITEMMINPKVKADKNAEWFELYNGGKTTVSIQGWSITDQAGSNQNKHTILANVYIKPGAYVVLGKFYDKTANGGVTVNYAYGKNIWDLGNGGDEIYLYDASKKLIDKVVYTKTWTIPNGATLSLKNPTLDNSVAKNWCVEKTKWCSTCDMGTPGKKAGCK